MKLIITIPKEKYIYIQELERGNTDYAITRMLYHAVKRGTPLDDVKAENKGEWITNELNANYSPFDTSQEHLIRCSVCHNVANWKYDFCPNCGADMRGVSE